MDCILELAKVAGLPEDWVRGIMNGQMPVNRSLGQSLAQITGTSLALWWSPDPPIRVQVDVEGRLRAAENWAKGRPPTAKNRQWTACPSCEVINVRR
jgi:hypothetical protein